jgi:hypothetical protein
MSGFDRPARETQMKGSPVRHILAAVAFLLAVVSAASPATAHMTSYGFLKADLGEDSVSGQLELAVRDLDIAYELDADRDGKVTSEELQSREQEIAARVFAEISIGSRLEPCTLEPGALSLDIRGGETYAIFPFSGHCEELGRLVRVTYDLMFDIDPQHRALVDFRRDESSYSGVMTPDIKVIEFDLGTNNLRAIILSYIQQGAHHIWIGYDHILFLVTLLLSAVLIRTGREWLPVEDFSAAFWSTAKVVTAFTLAHSVTLSVAAFGLVELPSRLVESVIAASIVVAAINNLFPIVTRRLWVAAFVFGLMHGFGFASVLNEFGLPPDRKLTALLSFNVGVELGQLAIVVGVLPILFLARRSLAYTRVVMPVGSVVIALVATLWLVERATGVTYVLG